MKLLPVQEFIAVFKQTAIELKLNPDFQCIGLSKKGRKIYLVKIPNMPKTTIFLGFPHPNEPLCELILQGILYEAKKHQSKGRGKFWYIVPVWDIDGALENETWWIEDEITLLRMADHWFRPSPGGQVEWTFPLNYGDIHFNQPLPETEAIRKLIDNVHPDLLVSLHNGVFPDGYILISDTLAELASLLNNQLRSNKISIKRNSPIPYIDEFFDGVFGLPHASLEIDYLKQLNQDNILSFYENGAGSFDYVDDSCTCIVLELPFFNWVHTEPSKELRKVFANKQLKMWESFQKDLFDAFTQQELITTNEQLLSSPEYFFRRSNADTAMIKNSLNHALSRNEMVNESDLISYIGMLFTITTQYSQLYRGAGFKTTTGDILRKELDKLGAKYLKPIDYNDMRNSGVGIISDVLEWLEQKL